jgi:hypothetical protein
MSYDGEYMEPLYVMRIAVPVSCGASDEQASGSLVNEFERVLRHRLIHSAYLAPRGSPA